MKAFLVQNLWLLQIIPHDPAMSQDFQPKNGNFSPGELTPIDHGWDQLIVHPENERGEPHNVDLL